MEFKLTKRDGPTRKINFPTGNPVWSELAEKIHSLYSIPLDQVSVTYLDAEDDEVTCSTNEELQDFYKASYRPGQVIRFTVQDLRSNRGEDKSLPQTPRSNVRNTFGREGGLPFDIDEDWHIPTKLSMADMFRAPSTGMDSPHAFVEVVPSDATSVSTHHNDNRSDSSSSVGSELPTARTDKGKAKATDEKWSSTVSLLGNFKSSKPDVHVMDVSGTNHLVDVGPPSSYSSSLPGSAPIESTPKASTAKLDEAASAAKSTTAAAADPPLPTFETPNVTLTQDIANLLTVLGTVVAAHPELSEGLRNIVHNASTGSYWSAHRDAVQNATEQLTQTATNAEAEAGRRVAESLGHVFRAISNVVGPMNVTPTAANPQSNDPLRQPTTSSIWYGPTWRTSMPTGHRGHPSPFFMRPPFGAPPQFGGLGHRGRHAHPGPPPPPPPPPPPGASMDGPPPFVPPPPPPGTFMNDDWSSFWAAGFPGPGPQPAPKKLEKKDLRAQVEAAKLLYKAEKERYREEREERKRAHHMSQLQTVAPQPVPSFNDNDNDRYPDLEQVSHRYPELEQVKDRYPELERVNVLPRRSNTLPTSTTSNRPLRNIVESPTARSLTRINKKLADMGFTENAHPELTSKIKAQLPTNGSISKENEDDIVTNLLEELIMSPDKGPQASGSGSRGKDEIPGAWN
ncbi:hypothetical protein C8J56DRAFT_818074 [Mycena floridula]|nr:hypothetical protein C8J56DRAFT_818074 [Mycena floridula]